MSLKYFQPKEFKMNGEVVYDKMDQNFLEKLDKLREIAGFPFILTSTYRDEETNRKAGGAKSSQHLLGKAADIKVTNGWQKYQIVKGCIELGMSFGVAKTFIHVDSRDSVPVMWTY